MMKKTGLSKHYGALSARERLVLLYAAAERGDRAEVAALTTSAPVADYFWIKDAFSQIHNGYLSEELAYAASFNLWAERAFSRKKGDRDTVRVMAYNLVVWIDSWRAFCRDLGVDPRWKLLNPAGPAKIREYTERSARKMAFSENEALAAVRKKFGSTVDHVWTVSSCTELWHNLFDELVRKYEPVASAGRSSHRQASAPRRARR